MFYFVPIFIIGITLLSVLTLVCDKDKMNPILKKYDPYIEALITLYGPYAFAYIHSEIIGYVCAVYNCWYFCNDRRLNKRIAIIALIINIVYYSYLFKGIIS